jgi:hypothetical protein
VFLSFLRFLPHQFIAPLRRLQGLPGPERFFSTIHNLFLSFSTRKWYSIDKGKGPEKHEKLRGLKAPEIDPDEESA